MAHEIDKTADGRDAMVYRGRTPWHRKGTELTAAETRDLTAAIHKAGLDFEVAKVTHYTRVPLKPGDPRPPDLVRGGIPYRLNPSEDARSVVRRDTHGVIGTVDPSWHPLQNRDAFEPLRSLLESGVASIDTAGVLRGGKQVWMLVRFDVDTVLETAWELTRNRKDKAAQKRLIDTFRGERGGGILPYGLFSNDHSGSGSAVVKATAIRVVCANTLDFSLMVKEGFSIKVPHNRQVKEAYAEAARQLFHHLARRYQELADQRAVLQKRVLDEKSFFRLVLDQAAPIELLEREVRGGSLPRVAEKLLEARLQQRSEIRRLWDEGAGHRGDHSAWEAYNALVEWVDHADSAGPEAHRVQSLTDGPLRRIKRGVLVGLLRHANQAAPKPVIESEMKGMHSIWAPTSVSRGGRALQESS